MKGVERCSASFRLLDEFILTIWTTKKLKVVLKELFLHSKQLKTSVLQMSSFAREATPIEQLYHFQLATWIKLIGRLVV